MARPRVRDSSTQAAVTESTYRKAKTDRVPPVAATTAVMSVVSSRQMSHAIRRGSAGGPKTRSTPDDTMASRRASARIPPSPGTRPAETNGPSASNTTATPSRAQENPRSGPPTLTTFTTSLHQGDQAEDRQVHRDDEATDHHAEEDDHDGFQQRRERGDRGVDLVVVEVGDLRQHLVEGAGVLADADHVHDHGREDRAALERLGQRAARRDGGAGLHDGALDDSVAGRASRDEEPLEDGNAGRDERAQRPGEPGDRDLADQHAEDRHLEQEGVDHVAALVGVVVALDPVDDAGAHADHQQDVALRELRDEHDDLGRQRELRAQALEHLGERRDDEDHHEHDDQQRHADDRDRVDHRSLDLALQLGGLLDVAGQALEDDVEHTARLTDLEHVGEEVVEDLRVLPERLGKGGAALDLAGDLAGDVAEGLRVALLGQDREALRERQASVDHRGELPCVDGQVLVLDLTADLLDGRDLGRALLDRGGDDAPRAQLRDRGGAIVGLDLAGDQGASRAAAIRVQSHGAFLLPLGER